MSGEQGALGRRRERGLGGAGPGGQRVLQIGGEPLGIHARLLEHLTRGRHLGGGPQQVYGIQVGAVLGGLRAGGGEELVGRVAEQPSDGYALHGRRRGGRAHTEEAIEEIGKRVA